MNPYQFVALLASLYMTARLVGWLRLGMASYLVSGLWAVSVALLVVSFIGGFHW